MGNWFKVRWHKQAKEEGNGVVEARGAPKERNGDANSQQSTAEEPPGVADGAAESGNASAVGGKDELAEDVPGARDRG